MVKANLIFMVLVLMLPLAAASDVAYIYDKEGKIDRNVVDVFKELNLEVDFINKPTDLSNYKLVFVDDDGAGENIELNSYPAVIASYSLGESIGLTDKDGTSKLASTQPLKVKFEGSEIEVYTSGRDARGIAIPYYFLDNENKDSGLVKYAGTYSTSSGKDFGDVISFAPAGTLLSNGKTVKSGICFFGIVKSNYWTPEAKELFKDCIKYVYDYTYVPPQDVTCSQDDECFVFSMLDSQPFCEGNQVAQNYTSPKCINPGTEESYCAYEELTRILADCSFCVDGECGIPNCNEDKDCDDGFLFTEDICINPSTEHSECRYDFKNDLEIITVIATSTQNSVTLNLYHNATNMSGIKGYYISDNGINWTFLPISNSSYEFISLAPSTDYTFNIQIVDYHDLIIQEMLVEVKTSSPIQTSVIEVAPGGGGGGGCITKWKCTEWSECQNNLQTRECFYPKNHCKPYAKKPAETQDCIMPPHVLEEPEITPQTARTTNTIDRNFAESEDNQVSPITGAAISIPGSVSSDWTILISAVALMILITVYFFITSPKAD